VPLAGTSTYRVPVAMVRGRAVLLGGMYGGRRPQRDCLVRAFDASGREVDGTVIDDLGAFALDLAPGLYRLRAEFGMPVEQTVEVEDQDLSMDLVWHIR